MTITPVVVRNEHLYERSGWVKIRHMLFSHRMVWYMRLAGSTLMLHQKFDSAIELEYSLIGCSVHKSTLFARRFTLRLRDGTKLRICCDTKRDAKQWNKALTTASRLVFEQHFEILDQVEERNKRVSRTLFNAVDKLDGLPVSVQQISRDALAAPDFGSSQALARELYAVRHVGHHTLQWAHSTFHEADNAYIVTRRVTGKKLVDVIEERGGSLPEWTVRAVSAQIVEALVSMHRRGYVHRNVTLNSIWCNVSDDEGVKVVLSDFENVGFVDDVEDLRLKGEIGDAMYLAPEMMRNSCYNSRVDLFALGVCVYRMLSGSFPFQIDVQRRSKSVEQREQGVTFEGEVWEQVSKEAREFVRGLLEPQYMKRLNAIEAHEHEWFGCNLRRVGHDRQLNAERTQKEEVGEKERTKSAEVAKSSERMEGRCGVTDIKALLKKDEALLSPFMKRFLSPLSDEAPLSAKSAVDAYVSSLGRYKASDGSGVT